MDRAVVDAAVDRDVVDSAAVDHAVVPPGWVPRSPCTPGCLSAPAVRRGPVLVAARLAALVAVLVVAVAGAILLSTAPSTAFSTALSTARDRWLRRCCRGALRAIGVTLRVSGDGRFSTVVEPAGGVLVVANHLSWIDVLALYAVQPVRMLAKREVRSWPVVGTLAVRTGAVFVDRSGLRTLPATVAATADALRAGAAVGVFPEGTTWCGAAAGPFRRAAFQAALDAGVPVRPVGIVFRQADDTPAAAAAFVGDQTLSDSVLRVLRLPGLVCHLRVQPVIRADDADRRALARRAGDAVGTATGMPHPGSAAPAVPPPRRLTPAA